MGNEGTLSFSIEEVFSAENRRDPHPLYHRLRTEQPIALAPEFNEYVLTRWADCEAVLRDPKWSSSPEHRPTKDGEPNISETMNEVGLKTLLFLDPPDHPRWPRLVWKAFPPRRIEQLREHVTEILDDLLVAVKPGEPFDVITT